MLALGLQNGSIAIYSPVHGRIVKTLAGSHTLPINDFVFNQAGNVGYSVSEDHHVVEWDIEEGREIRLVNCHIGELCMFRYVY